MKITLDHLTKRFKSRDKNNPEDVIAVNDFSFEIPDGELVSLLGPSGCGKSTCLNLICGLETASSGRIFFDEDDVTKLPPEVRGVGMVFQSYALYPHLTVRKNIEFPLGNLKGKDKMTKEQMDAKADEVAKLVQIDGLMERKPSELSGGQQQRVAIARALVKMPRVLLLDEPLSNLDARLRLATREEIRRIQQETKITMIFVTHDQEEAMSISDRMVVMKAGILQQIGKPQSIYDDPTNLFVAKFLGTPAINVLEGELRGGNLYIGEDIVLTGIKTTGMGALSNEDPAAAAKRTADAADSTSAEGGSTAAGSRKVYIGIRPEGFVLDENGPFRAQLVRVEVLGRDTSMVLSHEGMAGENIRAIISADDYKAGNTAGTDKFGADPSAAAAEKSVCFRLKPHKVFLFDHETEERIRYEQ